MRLPRNATVHAALILSVSVATSTAGCEHANQVTGPVVKVIPTPTPAPSITGKVQGSIHYDDPDWWFPCGEAAVSVTFVQTGSAVTASLDGNACLGRGLFEGTRLGNQLNGTLSLDRHGTATAKATGSVSGVGINLGVPGGQEEISGFEIWIPR